MRIFIGNYATSSTKAIIIGVANISTQLLPRLLEVFVFQVLSVHN